MTGRTLPVAVLCSLALHGGLAASVWFVSGPAREVGWATVEVFAASEASSGLPSGVAGLRGRTIRRPAPLSAMRPMAVARAHVESQDPTAPELGPAAEPSPKPGLDVASRAGPADREARGQGAPGDREGGGTDGRAASDSGGSLVPPGGGFQVLPAYPEAARRKGIEGTTLLRLHIREDGAVDELIVARSAGHVLLDQAAVEAVQRWRFEPARRGDRPVAVWVSLPIRFRLE